MPAEKSEMDKFEDKLDRILIRKMLDILTPAQKRRLRMFYFEGRSYQENAICDGVTRQSVKLSVKSDLRRLRHISGDVRTNLLRGEMIPGNKYRAGDMMALLSGRQRKEKCVSGVIKSLPDTCFNVY